MSKELAHLTRGALAGIKPYVPGKPIEEVEREYGLKDVIKLASNENPLGPSPLAVDSLQEAASRVQLYPDGSCHYLREELAAHLGLEPKNLIIGNGSDEILKLVAETFINEGDEAVMANPSFSEYDFCVTLMGGRSIKVPLDADFRHQPEAMLEAVTPRTKLIFICNPNNPTGTIISGDQIKKMLSQLPDRALIVFDEAYYEYVDDPEYLSGMELVKSGWKNVLVLRTFSKIYGLAGLRVGYGMGHEDLISWINRAREPFNVNSLAQLAARAALRDKAHVQKSRQMNSQEKEYLYGKFKELGLPYVPTQANFIFVDLKTNCREVFRRMLEQGVIIRTGDIFGHDTFIRVTIGTREQNQRFIRTLEEVLKSLR